MKLTIQEITQQLSHINTLISQEINESDYPALLSYLNELSAWQGNSGKCVADSEYYLNDKLESVFKELMSDVNLKNIAPTVLTKYTNAKCKEYIYLLKLAERYNRGITHRCDSIRSILSFAKAELTVNR
jgi:hypothetical protein